MSKALLLPLGQRALRLQTQPAPGHLDGHILSLVLLYEIHRIERFPSVQDFAS